MVFLESYHYFLHRSMHPKELFFCLYIFPKNYFNITIGMQCFRWGIDIKVILLDHWLRAYNFSCWHSHPNKGKKFRFLLQKIHHPLSFYPYNWKNSVTDRCSVTSKNSPNVYKISPKIISQGKWKILTTLQKLPKNVADLGNIIVATGFEKSINRAINKCNKSPNLVTLDRCNRTESFVWFPHQKVVSQSIGGMDY